MNKLESSILATLEELRTEHRPRCRAFLMRWYLGQCKLYEQEYKKPFEITTRDIGMCFADYTPETKPDKLKPSLTAKGVGKQDKPLEIYTPKAQEFNDVRTNGAYGYSEKGSPSESYTPDADKGCHSAELSGKADVPRNQGNPLEIPSGVQTQIPIREDEMKWIFYSPVSEPRACGNETCAKPTI